MFTSAACQPGGEGGEAPEVPLTFAPAAFQTNQGGMGVSSWLWNLILLPCPEATRRFPPAPFPVIFLFGTPGEGARLVSAQPER